MSLLDQLAEKHILAAQRQGDLDNLAGAGQPLQLDDDSHVPAELRASYRILKILATCHRSWSCDGKPLSWISCCVASPLRMSAISHRQNDSSYWKSNLFRRVSVPIFCIAIMASSYSSILARRSNVPY